LVSKHLLGTVSLLWCFKTRWTIFRNNWQLRLKEIEHYDGNINVGLFINEAEQEASSDVFILMEIYL